MSSLPADIVKSRRRFPRRTFIRKVGVLYKGLYFVALADEVGEGGLSLSSEYVLENGVQLVLNFQIPGGDFVSVRSEVRSSKKKAGQVFHGLAFVNIEFGRRRQIRMFVSSQTDKN